jgi:hypothetical protein
MRAEQPATPSKQSGRRLGLGVGLSEVLRLVQFHDIDFRARGAGRGGGQGQKIHPASEADASGERIE